jgi:hypothetical protein
MSDKHMMADRKNLKNYRKHDTFCSSCSLRLDIVFLGFFSSLPRRMSHDDLRVQVGNGRGIPGGVPLMISISKESSGSPPD